MSRGRMCVVAFIALMVASEALGANLRSPPITLSDDPLDRGECLIANVSSKESAVEITARCASGASFTPPPATLAPGEATFVLFPCPSGAFTCEFDADGKRRNFRAAACHFILAHGCGAAVSAY